MQVKKRNGEIVPYDLEKISIAISGAFQDFDEEFEDINVLNSIDDDLYNWDEDPIFKKINELPLDMTGTTDRFVP